MTDAASPSTPDPAFTGKIQNPSEAPHPAQPGQEQEKTDTITPKQDDNDGSDSVTGDNESSFESTASIASSILHYRTIQGRTYHSERHNVEYFTPNDEQQRQSIDITHQYLQVLLNGRLYLAPIKDNPEKVLDIGTGTGIWAIDFADAFPGAEVIGTDLSPIQPTWVPPNLKFEIEDCTKEWTWPDNTFDFVHMRVLIGAIGDWNRLFEQAYRTCKPGGWVESIEPEVIVLSDDDTISVDSPYHTLTRLLKEGGAKLGNTFMPVSLDVQIKPLEAAGFVERHHVDFKLPIGGWASDERLAETGRYVQLTLENDIEGYTLFIWKQVLEWPDDEYRVFLNLMRKELRNKKVHGYFKMRFVWGQKPESSE